MAKWLNRVAIAAPRNGTTTHTVNPASGTVVNGTLFTPTAGRLLVVACEGAVTSTTPSGWTLPTGGSAVNFTGLYVWWRTAAGSDTFTTTHNTANYPAVFDIYEYPAGTTFSGAASSTGVASGGAGPSVGSLTGTNLIMGTVGNEAFSTSSAGTVGWASGVEAIDTLVVQATTSGYLYSLTYLEDSVLTSSSIAATISGASNLQATYERLMFAVKVAATAAIPPSLIMQTRRPY
jgi:hypothetical protein